MKRPAWNVRRTSVVQRLAQCITCARLSDRTTMPTIACAHTMKPDLLSRKTMTKFCQIYNLNILCHVETAGKFHSNQYDEKYHLYLQLMIMTSTMQSCDKLNDVLFG